MDQIFLKVDGESRYLWRAVDYEDTVFDAIVTKKRDCKAALIMLKTLMKRYGRPAAIVTDRRRSYSSVLRRLKFAGAHETGRCMNNRAENSHLVFRRKERAMCKFRSDKTYRNSHPYNGKYKTISTETVTSTQDNAIGNIVLKHLQNVGNLQHEYICHPFKWRPCRTRLTAPPLRSSSEAIAHQKKSRAQS